MDSSTTSLLTVAFNANGNTLSDAQGRSFTWDFENRLTQAVNPGVGTTTFRYDPFGRRIQKSGPLGTTNYLYDGMNAIEEVDSSGTLLARYAQDAGIDEPLSALRSGATAFYETDGLGSISSLRSLAGTISNSYTYDAFGNATALSGSFVNPYRYTGRDYDLDTGLQYSRARYYDPSIGRFINEDPSRYDGGFNFYVYVWNDPIDLNDPFGLRALTDCEKKRLSPYVPKVDLDNTDLHDGEQPWWLPNKKENIAVTVYNDIYIREGEYDPTTPEGLALLAHELYHVGQYRKKEMTKFSYLREAARHGGGPENKYEKPAYDFGDSVQNDLSKGGKGPDCGCKKP